MQITDLDELTNLSDDAEIKYREWANKNKYKGLKRKAEYRKIHEDEECKIYIPDNEAAACLLGMNTKWCTAALTSKNYYHEYHEQDDPLFIIIRDDGRKYQFHFGTNQFMGEDDRPIDSKITYYYVKKYFDLFLSNVSAVSISSFISEYIRFKTFTNPGQLYAEINFKSVWAGDRDWERNKSKYFFT